MRRTDPKDSNKRYFRAGDRIVSLNSAWYFSSREGDLGPYNTRGEAEREVQRFLHERKQLSNFQSSRQVAPKQVPKRAAKPSAMRGNAINRSQQTRNPLDQKVESGSLALTVDDDLLI